MYCMLKLFAIVGDAMRAISRAARAEKRDLKENQAARVVVGCAED